MERIEILDAIVGENERGRCKTTIGFFVEQPVEDGDNKLLEEFYVEKPIVQINEFSDVDGNQFYSIEFKYKSRRDEDLKQQWRFLERYVERCNNVSDETVELPVLVVSLVPTSLRGKFSVLATPALFDSITRTEYAGDNTCTVRILFFKDDVMFLAHEEKLVDRNQIEAEVSREIDETLSTEYGEG